jgi:hypothetical protein
MTGWLAGKQPGRTEFFALTNSHLEITNAVFKKEG